jgi:hypothetical protein
MIIVLYKIYVKMLKIEVFFLSGKISTNKLKLLGFFILCINSEPQIARLENEVLVMLLELHILEKHW